MRNTDLWKASEDSDRANSISAAPRRGKAAIYRYATTTDASWRTYERL